MRDDEKEQIPTATVVSVDAIPSVTAMAVPSPNYGQALRALQLAFDNGNIQGDIRIYTMIETIKAHFWDMLSKADDLIPTTVLVNRLLQTNTQPGKKKLSLIEYMSEIGQIEACLNVLPFMNSNDQKAILHHVTTQIQNKHLITAIEHYIDTNNIELIHIILPHYTFVNDHEKEKVILHLMNKVKDNNDYASHVSDAIAMLNIENLSEKKLIIKLTSNPNKTYTSDELLKMAYCDEFTPHTLRICAALVRKSLTNYTINDIISTIYSPDNQTLTHMDILKSPFSNDQKMKFLNALTKPDAIINQFKELTDEEKLFAIDFLKQCDVALNLTTFPTDFVTFLDEKKIPIGNLTFNVNDSVTINNKIGLLVNKLVAEKSHDLLKIVAPVYRQCIEKNRIDLPIYQITREEWDKQDYYREIAHQIIKIKSERQSAGLKNEPFVIVVINHGKKITNIITYDEEGGYGEHKYSPFRHLNTIKDSRGPGFTSQPLIAFLKSDNNFEGITPIPIETLTALLETQKVQTLHSIHDIVYLTDITLMMLQRQIATSKKIDHTLHADHLQSIYDKLSQLRTLLVSDPDKNKKDKVNESFTTLLKTICDIQQNLKDQRKECEDDIIRSHIAGIIYIVPFIYFIGLNILRICTLQSPRLLKFHEAQIIVLKNQIRANDDLEVFIKNLQTQYGAAPNSEEPSAPPAPPGSTW